MDVNCACGIVLDVSVKLEIKRKENFFCELFDAIFIRLIIKA